jgi:hypothetical protein
MLAIILQSNKIRFVENSQFSSIDLSKAATPSKDERNKFKTLKDDHHKFLSHERTIDVDMDDNFKIKLYEGVD